MNKKYALALTIVIVIIASGVSSGFKIFDTWSLVGKAFADDSTLPAWVRNIFVWYGQKQVSEDELIGALKFLVQQGIIQLGPQSTGGGSHAMSGMSGMSSSMMSSNTPFNPNVPLNVPMIDGYYNGKKVFFIHTEGSDKDQAAMMAAMINFPVIQTNDLKNISPQQLGKVYLFTNGIHESSPYGGGAYMFQLDIFDSVPGDQQYSQFRVPQIVTWNDGSNPKLLTSVDQILQTQSNGEITIKSTDHVMNMPIMVWQSADGVKYITHEIDKIFLSMPNYKGEVENIDVDHHIATINLQPVKNG